jgi:hypothetical protein
MKSSLFSGSLLLMVLSTAACDIHWVREVKRTPSGGEVALLAQNGDAQAQAQSLMASRCPAGYDILEEGEAVVGQEVQSNTTQRQGFFGPTQSTTAQSQDKREWRIKYQCKGAGGAPVAPAGTAPAPKPAAVYEIVIRNY